MNISLDISITYYKNVILNFKVLSCLIKKVQERKTEHPIWESNPGSYGWKLICKAIMLNSAAEFLIHLGI